MRIDFQALFKPYSQYPRNIKITDIERMVNLLRRATEDYTRCAKDETKEN